MPQTPRVRLTAVALGALAMITSAIVGFYGSDAIAEIWPDAQPEGLQGLLVLFAPLTAVAVLLLGALWTRSLRASLRECIGALVIAEVVAWAIVGLYAGEWFGFYAREWFTLFVFVFPFWAGMTLVFAPWWLLAFWIVNRIRQRHAAALLPGLAVAIVLLSQVLLPASPFRTSSSRRALKEADVRNLRDELLLSAKGNPIGIRVVCEVVFPQAVVASVGLGLLETEAVPTVQSTQLLRESNTINPEPSSEGDYKRFESNRLYTFTATSKPGFLAYDEKTQQPCLMVLDNAEWSEAAIVSALKNRGPERYRMWVSMRSEHVRSVDHGRSLTSRDYDVNAMYRTIVTEGHQRCF
jgi:hypothetical protein